MGFRFVSFSIRTGREIIRIIETETGFGIEIVRAKDQPLVTTFSKSLDFSIKTWDISLLLANVY